MVLAAQLLSGTSAAAIRELYEDEESAADIISTIDNGFDVLNSRLRYADKNLRCGLGEHWEEQRAALGRMQRLMATARFGGKTTLVPCQKGWIISIRSTLGLFEDMRREPGFTFLLTSRLNQDLVESFFSMVRARFGSNLNPSPAELLQRMRLLMLGANPASSRETSIMASSAAPSEFLPAAAPLAAAERCDDCLSVSVLRQVLDPREDAPLEPASEPETVPAVVLDEAGLEPDGDKTEVNLSEAVDRTDRARGYGVAYAAGFVAKCARSDATLTVRSVDAEEVPSCARWVQLLSRGGLKVPSKDWLDAFSAMDVVFCDFHRGKGLLRRGREPDHLSREPGVKSLVGILEQKWPHLDARARAAFVHMRTRFRMRHVARLRRQDHADALREIVRKCRNAADASTSVPEHSGRVFRKKNYSFTAARDTCELA